MLQKDLTRTDVVKIRSTYYGIKKSIKSYSYYTAGDYIGETFNHRVVQYTYNSSLIAFSTGKILTSFVLGNPTDNIESITIDEEFNKVFNFDVIKIVHKKASRGCAPDFYIGYSLLTIDEEGVMQKLIFRWFDSLQNSKEYRLNVVNIQFSENNISIVYKWNTYSKLDGEYTVTYTYNAESQVFSCIEVAIIEGPGRHLFTRYFFDNEYKEIIGEKYTIIFNRDLEENKIVL